MCQCSESCSETTLIETGGGKATGRIIIHLKISTECGGRKYAWAATGNQTQGLHLAVGALTTEL